jgi:hypothetical protein
MKEWWGKKKKSSKRVVRCSACNRFGHDLRPECVKSARGLAVSENRASSVQPLAKWLKVILKKCSSWGLHGHGRGIGCPASTAHSVDESFMVGFDREMFLGSMQLRPLTSQRLLFQVNLTTYDRARSAANPGNQSTEVIVRRPSTKNAQPVQRKARVLEFLFFSFLSLNFLTWVVALAVAKVGCDHRVRKSTPSQVLPMPRSWPQPADLLYAAAGSTWT